MKFNVFFLCVAFLCSSYQTVPTKKAALVLDARATLGEGSFWHPVENKLYWIDIEGKFLHIYDPSTKKDIQFPTGSRIGTVVPVKNGNVLVALQNGIHKMDTKTGKLTFITDPVKDSLFRFNDGKCDPAGRFWVGTMHLGPGKGGAALYRFDKDKTVHKMLDNVSTSNGIVWSADKKTMYYIDTPTGAIQAFDYDNSTGDISNGRNIIKVTEGYPDGMAIDAEGMLWTALWGGGGVARWNPATGKMLEKIEVPAVNITSCAFGGKQLDTLYITTARIGMNEEQLKKFPLSGGVFAIKPGVKGVPVNFYEGDL